MPGIFRHLSRRPGFAVLAISTLALGIGASAVIFSFAYGVLLSPLPYANTSRLALLWTYDRTSKTDPAASMSPMATVPAGDFQAWRRQTRTLERLDAFTFAFYSIRAGRNPTEVVGARVTPGFFSTVGVRPLLGRTLSETDPEDVIVLGYGMWQSQYGGDRSIVGRQVFLNDRNYTVAGVLPPEFFFYIRDFALWAPLPADSRMPPVIPVGLLRRGVTFDQAQAELDTIARRLESEFPDTHKNRGARLIGLRAQYSRFFRRIVWVLFGSVAFLLLIACANVASLLLARATEREKEMAIRVALGASRWRIVRHLLGESAVIALAAGGLAIIIGYALIPIARNLLPLKLPIPLPGIENIRMNVPVLLFAVALSAVTVLFFGVVPALRSAAVDPRGRSTSPGVRHSRLLDAIVVAELAAAVVLLTGAGLTVRSLNALYGSLGFRSDHVLTFRTPGVGPERAPQFSEEVTERLRGIPGVETVAASYSLPGTGMGGRAAIVTEGQNDPNRTIQSSATVVSPEFFRTLRIALLAGRAFTGQDHAGAPEVAIVGASLARKLYPGDNPIGRRIRLAADPADRWTTIVGVVSDVRPFLTADPVPVLYRPFAQHPTGAIGFIIKTAADPLALAPAVKAAVWRIRRDQPITYVTTLDNDLADEGFRERLSAIGLGWFAALGLALSCIGVYGLIMYAVKQRIAEIAVRMAIGATRADIVRLMVMRGAVLTGAGLVIGVAVALAVTRVLKSVLYGVKPIDAPTFLTAAGLLALCALLACYVPARKAASADPMVALRAE